MVRLAGQKAKAKQSSSLEESYYAHGRRRYEQPQRGLAVQTEGGKERGDARHKSDRAVGGTVKSLSKANKCVGGLYKPAQDRQTTITDEGRHQTPTTRRESGRVYKWGSGRGVVGRTVTQEQKCVGGDQEVA